MPATLRILSANLWNGRARPASLESVLSSVGADVVALQELAPNAAEVVEPRYRHGRLDPRTDYHGLGIGALRPVEVAPIELSFRSGWKVTLHPADWPEISKPLDVLNVHFMNPLEPPPWQAVRIRREQVAGVLAAADVATGSGGRGFVVVGDFNSSPVWPAYRALRKHLTDAAAAARSAAPTWGPTAAFPRLLRIDHAFVRGVRPVTTRTVRIAGTDHSALVVDLEV